MGCRESKKSGVNPFNKSKSHFVSFRKIKRPWLNLVYNSRTKNDIIRNSNSSNTNTNTNYNNNNNN